MHWGTKGGKQKGKEMEGLGRGKGTEREREREREEFGEKSEEGKSRRLDLI